MLLKPSPGPWRYSEGCVVDRDSRIVAYVNQGIAREARGPQAAVDGQAIALLPDLIEALHAIFALRHPEFSPVAAKIAYAALIKLGGE